MDMGKSVNVLPQQSTAKQKPCAYFLGYTVRALSQLEDGLVNTESAMGDTICSVNLMQKSKLLVAITERVYHDEIKHSVLTCFL